MCAFVFLINIFTHLLSLTIAKKSCSNQMTFYSMHFLYLATSRFQTGGFREQYPRGVSPTTSSVLVQGKSFACVIAALSLYHLFSHSPRRGSSRTPDYVVNRL